MIKKLPLPIAGLMLALAATGNLLVSYGNGIRNIFGILSFVVMLLIVAKIVTAPSSVKEGFENPVVASVMPTFSMGIILLATYIKPFAASVAFGVWIIGIVLHVMFILAFTKKYMLNFNIKKVFPSYFIVYVGIVCASVTAPAFGMAALGKAIFYFGFLAYLVLLPIVMYRTSKFKEIPEPALPTLIIYAAPASLCLAGYLNSFEVKNIYIIGFLAALSIVMCIFAFTKVFKLLKLKFYPSNSAFTFPFVITAIAFKGLNGFLIKNEMAVSGLKYLVIAIELWATGIVIYVLVRYFTFLTTPAPKAKPESV